MIYGHLLGPFPQESHQTYSKRQWKCQASSTGGNFTSTHTHHGKRIHDGPQARPPHHTAEHELVRHQLHQARIDQDAGADAIEHALHNQRRLRSRRICLPESQAHRHGYRR